MFKRITTSFALLAIASSAQAQEEPASEIIGGQVTEVGSEVFFDVEAQAATGSLDITERMHEKLFEAGIYDVRNNTNGALLGFGVSNNDTLPVFPNSQFEVIGESTAISGLSLFRACTTVNDGEMDEYRTCYKTRQLNASNWGTELVFNPLDYLPPEDIFLDTPSLTLAAVESENGEMMLQDMTQVQQVQPEPLSPLYLLPEFELKTFQQVYGDFEIAAGGDNTINWFDFSPEWEASYVRDVFEVRTLEVQIDCLPKIRYQESDMTNLDEAICLEPVSPEPTWELLNDPLLAGDELNDFFGFSGTRINSSTLAVIGTQTGLSYVTTNPAPVPLPAAGWMLIAGVGGLVAAGRRKRG